MGCQHAYRIFISGSMFNSAATDGGEKAAEHCTWGLKQRRIEFVRKFNKRLPGFSVFNRLT
jgi:hypothetical protein